MRTASFHRWNELYFIGLGYLVNVPIYRKSDLIIICECQAMQSGEPDKLREGFYPWKLIAD